MSRSASGSIGTGALVSPTYGRLDLWQTLSTATAQECPNGEGNSVLLVAAVLVVACDIGQPDWSRAAGFLATETEQ